MKKLTILYGVAGAVFSSMYLGNLFYNLSKEKKIEIIDHFKPLFEKILGDIYEYYKKSEVK